MNLVSIFILLLTSAYLLAAASILFDAWREVWKVRKLKRKKAREEALAAVREVMES